MRGQNRTFQSNMTGGELSPAMYSRTDVAKYQTGVKEGVNVIIKPEGGMRSVPGTQFVGEVAISTQQGFLLPFDLGVGETYVLEFGQETLRFIRDGAYILDSTRENAVTGAIGSPGVFTAVAHGFSDGERVWVDQIVAAGATHLNNRFFTVDNATTDTFTLVDEWGDPIELTVTVSAGRATADYVLSTPYDLATLGDARLNFAQDQDTMYLLSRKYPVYRLTRIAPDDWTLTLEDFQPSIDAPTGVNVTALVGSGSTTYKYKVSAISEESGEESLPSAEDTITNDLSIAGNKNQITWSAVTGAARYVVYKDDNGVFGYIGGTTGLSFVDENITSDLSDTPQQGRNPFTGTGNYPGCGTFFEQRLFLASTDNNPTGVWGSQSANPRNFGVSSPVKADDAVTFRVRANRVTTIEALVPTERLLMLTRSGEWLVRGSSQEEYLTPTNVVLRQRAFRGSTAVPPVQAGDFVLHAQRGGRAVRDINFERDVVSSELTILARHLIPPGVSIRRMVFQQEPYSVVWVVLSDGRLIAMTYMLEHEIWGWTRMDFGTGIVEDVAVVEEADGDAVYMQVRRTVNGATKRYIERMENSEPTRSVDAFCVRCGVWADFDAPVSEIAGLSHLEGEEVVALVDGNVIRDLTVVDGMVTLPIEGDTIAIGLPYTARIRTLDIDVGIVRGLGSMLDRQKTATNVILRVENSRGLFIAHGDDELIEYRQRQNENYDEAIELFTGSIELTPYSDWTEGGDIVIEQRDPLPMTIAGILVDWEFGE